MLSILTLLLITQVCAEWVEITQQHYRKPIRTQNPFANPDKVIDVEQTTKPWTYKNHSIAEYNWNKVPARAPDNSNVKRVQLYGSTVKTTATVKFEDEDPDLDIDRIDYELRPNSGPTKTTLEFNESEKQKGKIERVPNLGNIKRVQLNNSPVKSPVINFKGEREKYVDRYKKGPHDDDQHTEAYTFEDNKNTELFNRRIYVNKVNTHHGSERTATFPPNDENTSFINVATNLNNKDSKRMYKNYSAIKNVYSTNPTFITETEDFNNYETKRNRFYNTGDSKSSPVTEIVNVFTTKRLDKDENIVTKNYLSITKPTTEKTIKNNAHRNINMNDFATESQEYNIHLPGNDKQEVIMANEHKTNIKANITKPEPEYQSENRYQTKKVSENNDKKHEKHPNETKTSDKVNAIENLIKFMRVVAATISRNSRRSFGGKMQYLHELKDSILANIEARIDSTWPDDDTGARRRSRSAHASPRGHVQFPSSESALMTISFLTFAVFLIKLVLQVIQTYKNKAMMVAPLVVAAAGRNMFTHH